MKCLSWIVIVTMILAGVFIAPMKVDAQAQEDRERSWEEIILDLKSTGPTVPAKLQPGKTRAVSTNMARALNENDDVRRINTAKYGRPKYDKGIWLEYPKVNLGIIPMGSRTSKPDVYPKREIHHAMLLFSRGSLDMGTNEPCVLVVTASTIQPSASARVQRSITFNNVRGDLLLMGNLSGNKLVFKRAGKKDQFTSRNCPQADGGIWDCINDTDVPDFWEPPCAAYWFVCAPVIVGNCVGKHW